MSLAAQREEPTLVSAPEPAPEKESAPVWVLRVLTGAQSGASLGLRAARYTLGGDESCDVVLAGEGIEPVHAECFFADGKLSLLRCHGEVLVNGAAAGEVPLDVAALEIVTLGEVSVSYGEEGSRWPDGEAVAASLAERAAARARAAAAAEDPAVVAARRAAKGRRRLATGAGTIFLSLVAAAVVWSVPPSGPGLPESMSATRSAPLKTLAMMLKGMTAFSAVRLEMVPDGGRRLAGYVETKADIVALRSLVRGEAVRFQVVSLEQLEESLSVLLGLDNRLLKYDVSASPDSGVGVVVRGVVDMPGDMEAFKEDLRQALPSIDRLEIRVVGWGTLEGRLMGAWAGLPEYSRLRLSMDAHGLTATGTLLSNYASGWRRGVEAVLSDLPVEIDLHESITLGPMFGGRVEGLFIGAESGVRLNFPGTGEEGFYRSGDRLPGGLLLAGIARDRLVLSDGVAEYVLPVEMAS